MSNALASHAALRHHPADTRIVDLRTQLRLCAVDDRSAWAALQTHLQESLNQHSHELHIEHEPSGLKLRIKSLSGFSECRLGCDDFLHRALQLLQQHVWPIEQQSLGNRAWFIINLEQHSYLWQLDQLMTSGGSTYTFRCLYDIQNPLPQLDQLIDQPEQARQLRQQLDRMKGLVLLADTDRISRVKMARAMAQSVASPKSRILLSETSCHPLVPGTTQIPLPLHAQLEHHQAWKQACDMSHDVIITLAIDHEPVRLVQLAAEGCLVVQGVGANNASQALAQLIANGVRPEAVSRVLSSVVVQHRIALACEACRCPTEIDETANDWLELQNPLGSGNIQTWLADRMSDNFVQANGCTACHHTGVSRVALSIDCLDVGHDIQDALCDGDVRYAMQALATLESHARYLALLARSGTVTLMHALEQLGRLKA